jgi:hypothetical protein
MKYTSVIKNNIIAFLEYKKITKYEFYKKTGISNGILSQKNGLAEENILRITTHFPELSETYLLTGQGNMLKNQEDGPQASAANEASAQKSANAIEKTTLDTLLDRIQIQAEEIGRMKFTIEELKNKMVVQS